MSDDGDWKNLSDEQITLLSEGFCPWSNPPNSCSLGEGKILRDGELVEYGACFIRDVFVRTVKGKPEVLPLETITERGWRVTECRT